MPFAAPLTEMLWNVTPAVPIVVLPLTFTPVPLPELIVLPMPVAVTVPPPVAVKPAVSLALVVSVRVSVKLIVAPVFRFRKMPSLAPVDDTSPSNETVPPVWV